MEKNIIETHNFEEAKNKIHIFSKTVPTNLTLSKFEKDGWLFGWGKHNVTGEEMNDFVLEIQGILIDYNKAIHTMTSTFQDVYSAFESLDKDYIQSILISVKASERASVQAKEANLEAISAQKDIRRTIDALEKTINALKGFKDSVSKDLDELQSEISIMKSYLEAEKDKNSIEYLNGIDSVWSDVQNRTTTLTNLQEQLFSFTDRSDLTTRINLIEEKRVVDTTQLTHKLKVAYVIAGGALMVTIIQFILNLLGII